MKHLSVSCTYTRDVINYVQIKNSSSPDSMRSTGIQKGKTQKYKYGRVMGFPKNVGSLRLYLEMLCDKNYVSH